MRSFGTIILPVTRWLRYLSVKQVYTGFLDLLRAKWLHTPGEPTPFTWSFAAAWCGMRSAGYVVSAIKWLLKEGYLRHVGVYRPAHGRKMAVFLPGGTDV